MSSPVQLARLPPVRPPTPGVRRSPTATSGEQQDIDDQDDHWPSRLASLDLTSTRDTYGSYETWTETQDNRDLP
jgi:hypothetical protein